MQANNMTLKIITVPTKDHTNFPSLQSSPSEKEFDAFAFYSSNENRMRKLLMRNVGFSTQAQGEGGNVSPTNKVSFPFKAKSDQQLKQRRTRIR